jgi:hypothetical protein
LGNRFVNIPGYLVRREEEPSILLHTTVVGSTFQSQMRS